MKTEIRAKIIDGKIVYFPRKKRGMSKLQFELNRLAAERLNKRPSSPSEPRQIKLFEI